MRAVKVAQGQQRVYFRASPARRTRFSTRKRQAMITSQSIGKILKLFLRMELRAIREWKSGPRWGRGARAGGLGCSCQVGNPAALGFSTVSPHSHCAPAEGYSRLCAAGRIVAVKTRPQRCARSRRETGNRPSRLVLTHPSQRTRRMGHPHRCEIKGAPPAIREDLNSDTERS
jgi:hypothetical protein